MLHMVDRSISTRRSKDEVVKSKVGLEKNEQNDAKRDGEVTLSGSMTRQTEQDMPVQDQTSHITNTGKMIEEMEIKMRNLLQEVRGGSTALAARVRMVLTRSVRSTLARPGTSSLTCGRLMIWRRRGGSASCRRSSWASSSGDVLQESS